MGTYQRTSTNILKVALSFFGTLDNLALLETGLSNKKIITLQQYANYLCQIALGIELGMKSIQINENDILEEHNLEFLYNKMPKVFHEMFEKTAFPKKITDMYLSKIKNIYVEFRYMDTENLILFIDKKMVNKQGYINFIYASDNKSFQFLRILLDEVKKIHKSIYKIFDPSQLPVVINQNVSKKLVKNIHEEIKKIQTSLCVVEKP